MFRFRLGVCSVGFRYDREGKGWFRVGLDASLLLAGRDNGGGRVVSDRWAKLDEEPVRARREENGGSKEDQSSAPRRTQR